MQWKLAVGVVAALGAMSAPLTAQTKAFPEAAFATVDSSYFSTAWAATRAQIDSTADRVIASSLRAFTGDEAFTDQRVAGFAVVHFDIEAPMPSNRRIIVPVRRDVNVIRIMFGS